MQNKGLIYTFAILFGLVSLYSISFTFFTNKVEKRAFEHANSIVTDGDGKELARVERHFLDSIANDTTLYFNLFTYNDIKEKALNLGLDLKGGINAILQVSVKDILIGLSNDSKNPIFLQALEAATEAQKTETKPFVSIFFDKFTKIADGNAKLGDPDIFGNKSLQDKINFNMTDKEVMPII